MSVAQPMKAHVIDQSLNESIVMRYYLLPPVNHHQLADLFFFHNKKLPLAMLVSDLWLMVYMQNTGSTTPMFCRFCFSSCPTYSRCGKWSKISQSTGIKKLILN